MGDRIKRGEAIVIAAREGAWLGVQGGGGKIEAIEGEVACEQEQG